MIDLTIQSIFLIGYAAFDQGHRLPEYVREAAHSIMSCRTSSLGGHIQSCPDGHFHRIWYNSCKHRMCPKCAYVQVQRWLYKQKARILNCDHYHVIFTIPDDLRYLWRLNTKGMTDILFSCARNTLFELLEDKRYLGAKPGIIATLHTWSKTLLLHPHIHCLVTGGGLTKVKEWLSVTNGYLLPFAVARDVFRRNVRNSIKKALEKGDLVLPEGMRARQLENILNRLGRKKWNVKICERYSHGNGVLTYLARYIRGGPIGNSRIVKIEDGKVTFNYGRAKVEPMTLPIGEFIGRFLQHIPLPSSILVRSYGIYSPSKKDDLSLCREILGQGPVKEPDFIDWQSCFEQSDDHPELCPICGKRLVCTGIVLPSSTPQHTADPPPIEEYRKAA
jgi:hypothetical protein